MAIMFDLPIRTRDHWLHLRCNCFHTVEVVILQKISKHLVHRSDGITFPRCGINSPTTSKNAYPTMKIRLRPNRKVQLSLRDPVMGDRKNPRIGDNEKTKEARFCGIPISNSIGDEKAVIAA